jgi:hypothetical protein
VYLVLYFFDGADPVPIAVSRANFGACFGATACHAPAQNAPVVVILDKIQQHAVFDRIIL